MVDEIFKSTVDSWYLESQDNFCLLNYIFGIMLGMTQVHNKYLLN